MKDKTIEQLEEYLESKDIHPHFSADIISSYEGGPIYDYQILTWEIEPVAMFTYRVEMNSGLSVLSLNFAHANFFDCMLVTDEVYKVIEEMGL